MSIARSDIAAAAARIEKHIHRTPVMQSTAFGLPLAFKFEHTQVTGSFKARGAFNSILTADVPAAGLIAASGGNHGAAVAHAATTLGHSAHIYVPDVAGPAKIDVIRQTGADLWISTRMTRRQRLQDKAPVSKNGKIKGLMQIRSSLLLAVAV